MATQGTNFGPTASLAAIKKRTQLLQQLRAFFYERNFYELDVPALGRHTVTDPYLEPLTTSAPNAPFLQTSPEFYLKRFLAAYAQNVFYLGKAYRAEEEGCRHRAEFTMLEWYAVGLNDRALMAQVADLMQAVAPNRGVYQVSYSEVFECALGVCPHRATEPELKRLAAERTGYTGALNNKSAWLDLLFSHVVEPTLTEGFTLVYDYPVEQAALAKIALNEQGLMVARRFEVFGAGKELANGYWELTDATEQKRRFEEDLKTRADQGLNLPDIDGQLMAALEAGLPECAGIALGVDRLLMVLLGEEHISAVVPFAEA